MKTADFDYHLPPEQIAQTPIEPRDASRLLILNRANRTLAHRAFRDIPAYLHPGDVLVFNQTRVIPARLHGHKVETGGKVEFLLLRREADQTWRGLIGGHNVTVGMRLRFDGPDGSFIEGAVITAPNDDIERIIRFDSPLRPLLDRLGEMPLPPYIHQRLADPERYQTVYARDEGSAAAPTAGLHFTPELLVTLRDQGIKLAYCTLHVGLDTFQPVREDDIDDHKIHTERAILTAADAKIINAAKLAGGRIIAVGTTSVRTLETAALRSAGVDDPYAEGGDVCPWRPVVAIDEPTGLFIRPGYRFRAVDALITNFHLPRSTLLALVSAFAGRETILNAYQVAQQEGYRFYSFGDAMLIE